MANKLKKETSPKKKTPAKKTAPVAWKAEKEEQVDWKALARDERTWKIIGVVFLLVATFLTIAIISYFFSWRQDQASVDMGGSILFGNEQQVSNLLGALGALVSHFFVFKAFGVASLLFSTFFFVVGVNLLFKRKVFSISRNLKYVTIGLLTLSVSLAFVAGNSEFAWGGGVGKMISQWLTGMFGTIGTAAILLVVALAYVIWQFNPNFNVPTRGANAPAYDEDAVPVAEKTKEEPFAIPEKDEEEAEGDEEETPVRPVAVGGNALKGDAPTTMQSGVPDEKPLHNFSLIEKEIPEEVPQARMTVEEDLISKEIVDDLMHEPVFPEETEDAYEEEVIEEEEIIEEETLPVKPLAVTKPADGLELEIKSATEELEDIPQELKPAPEKLKPYEPTLDLRDYQYPSLELLETHGSEKIVQDPEELETNKNQIISTLRNYSIEIQKISATVGPTVTLYEIVPAAGVRISRIKNLEDDIALSLAALGIRIIAPIPGKGTIGIEVPNARKTVVSMKTLLASEKFQTSQFSLPIAIGKKIDNENFIVDLAAMPHLLMAGATGQGKSVGLNAILVSLLYKKHPSQLKFVLVDPKKVELSVYSTITNHFLARLPNEEDAIITDTKKVINTLNALCIEMDQRYDLLKDAGCRNIKEYNAKFVSRKLNPEKGHKFLPFIVLVVDEFADLIMTAGKEVEMPIARLAQLARAVGIHLIIATQRPSVNIITGTIKANFPARIAFKVSSKIDSRTILDAGGAEQLIGKGDMLISYNGEIVRLQCAFVDTPEVDKVTDFIGYQEGYPEPFLLPEYINEKDLEGKDFDIGDRDSLFEDAARLIVQNQIGSTSLLQRRMKLGYNRAGRLMDQLEAAGIVGPNQGSKARDVLVKTESELQEILDLG